MKYRDIRLFVTMFLTNDHLERLRIAGVCFVIFIFQHSK